MTRASRIAASILVVTTTAAMADDRARLHEADLVLLSDNTACRLVQMTAAGDTVARLPLSGLCRFHRDDTGALRVMDSPEGPVLLVETTRALPDSPPDCDTHVLAIRLAGSGLTPAPAPARVTMCPPFQWDNVMFLGQF